MTLSGQIIYVHLPSAFKHTGIYLRAETKEITALMVSAGMANPDPEEHYVIHFTRGEEGSRWFSSGSHSPASQSSGRLGVQVTTLAAFAGYDEDEDPRGGFEDVPTTRSAEEIVRVALDNLGQKFGEYDVVNNNCQHFAMFCRTGRKVSFKADNAARFAVTVLFAPAFHALMAGANLLEWVSGGRS
mmetsp:Transcript_23623/g.53808  ORF Transcript_23623/g.53808 Transcript_23623/m.53808 type:complete len:186 (+) Transcript_23623:51-608(+)